nr:hypothetical protein [Mycolicibacterium baixiangningiae]
MNRPLGDYEDFRRWSGNPLEWGPADSGWRAWFGGRVVDGLCDVLDEHLAAPRSGRELYPAAIGCVPWLTSRAVASRLLRLDTFCIVVDKLPVGHRAMARPELINSGKGLPNRAILRLEDVVPADSSDYPKIIGPYTSREDLAYVIDPIRVLGWRKDGRPTSQPPLPHAKLLVLGEIGWRQYDTPYGTEEYFRFEPQRVWFGSANWTQASSYHLETGFVCDDDRLVRAAESFVADMIASSETVTSQFAAPERELVDLPWDDAAMAQAASEMEEAYEDYDAHEP